MKKVLSVPVLLSLLLSHSCAVKSGTGPAAGSGLDRPRIVNIVNFIRLCEPRIESYTPEVLFDTVVKQVEIMTKYRLGGTFLLQYDALLDARYQKLLKALPADTFEIGAWWEIPQPLVEKAGLAWRGRYPWDWHADVGFATGYSPAERERLADVYMGDFKRIFGHYPKSVGSWFIDARTLDYLHRKYGIIASCNCKDQVGTDGYTLWGGYWNQAYYPSRKNAYMPAQHEENQIPVPIFRMLGSDPIRQYDAGLGSRRQSVVSLEPVYARGGGDPAWVDWYFRQFVAGACMAFAYVQVGQENSFTWSRMAKGFEVQLPLIAGLRDARKVTVETLAESGRWFREHFKTTPATSVTAGEDLDGGTCRTAWFDSRFYRLNLLWQDGTLRFRDIHIFDEDLASDYLTARGTSTKCTFWTLPFVDGFNWSAGRDVAGLRFKTAVDGTETLIEGGEPAFSDALRGKLKITWPVPARRGAFVFDIDEDRIEIRWTGEPSPDWFLDLTAAENAELPFEETSARRVRCRFKGLTYGIALGPGSFSRPGRGIVFRMAPEKDVLILHIAPKDQGSFRPVP
jgi:hypothetical protein